MIKSFYQKDIIKRLAAVLTFGINERYSYLSVQERLIASNFINQLEDGEYDINLTCEDVINDVFHLKIDRLSDISYRGLFLAECYFRLFLTLNRSFAYIFMYWPLSTFVEKYNIYHEMDFSSMLEDFKKEVVSTTLMKKICEIYHVKYTAISALTGISLTTIVKYSRNDIYLYSASYKNIYKLARLFKVKENFFCDNLGVYLDDSSSLSIKNDKDYWNYLGFYIINYYDSRIHENEFIYHNHKFASITDDIEIEVMLQTDKLSLKNINSKTYLVWFIPNLKHIDYQYFKQCPAYEVMLITPEKIMMVKRNIIRDVLGSVNRLLVSRAKDKIKNEGSLV